MFNFLFIFRNKALLVVAHRLTTVAQCDRVIVLKDGRIVEQGAPHELLSKKGAFFKMVENCGEKTRKSVKEIIKLKQEQKSNLFLMNRNL